MEGTVHLCIVCRAWWCNSIGVGRFAHSIFLTRTRRPSGWRVKNYKRPFGIEGKVSNRRTAKGKSLMTTIGWTGAAVNLPHKSRAPITLDLQAERRA